MKYIKTDKPFYKDKDIKDAYLKGKEGAMPLIYYRSLDKMPWLRACFTTRDGGVSTGVHKSLNLGFSNGDTPSNVKKNYLLLAERLHIQAARLAFTDQVHEDRICYADEKTLIGNAFAKKTKNCDGLITKEKDVILTASFADCVPVYLADSHTRQIALVHSGWKGTVKQIAAKAATMMKENGSDPKTITAVIGPSISQENYEVTKEVVEAFQQCYSTAALKDIVYKSDAKHYKLDLWAAIFYSLKKVGLLADHIHFSGICTYDNANELFSHRKSNGKRGNLNALMWIPKDKTFVVKASKKEQKINEAPDEVIAQALRKMLGKD